MKIANVIRHFFMDEWGRPEKVVLNTLPGIAPDDPALIAAYQKADAFMLPSIFGNEQDLQCKIKQNALEEISTHYSLHALTGRLLEFYGEVSYADK